MRWIPSDKEFHQKKYSGFFVQVPGSRVADGSVERERGGQEGRALHGGVAHCPKVCFSPTLPVSFFSDFEEIFEREKLFVRCRQMKRRGLLKEVFTE